MRESVRKSSFRADVIENLKKAIQELQTVLNSGKVIKENVEDIKLSILDSYVSLIVANYSNGASKEKIKNLVLEALPAFEACSDVFKDLSGEDYDIVVWYISIAVLVELESIAINRIIEVLKKGKIQDYLIDTIIDNYDPSLNHKVHEGGVPGVGKPYSRLLNSSDIGSMKIHLKNWYDAHYKNESFWVDTDKDELPNAYVGYWSWESAEWVKYVLRLSPDDLKGVDYFPYDAVVW